MTNIAIRNLDDDVKTRLRVRTAGHHRSVEEEVLAGRGRSQRRLSTVVRWMRRMSG